MRRDVQMMKSTGFSCSSHVFPIGHRTWVMGILNVTPDSFSDGGCFEGESAALAHANRMCIEGASVVDVGGESTRPGFSEVDVDLEISRVTPVISALKSSIQVPISIDTYKGQVAEAAILAGASIINDVTGLHNDASIARIAATYHSGLILMYNARLDQRFAGSDNLIDTAKAYLSESIEMALRSGVQDGQIMIDPGIGFGLNTDQSLTMIRFLSEFRKLGYPILIGPSRKRFIGDILGLPIEKRDLGTIASCAVASANGADFVRVHSVGQTVEALAVVDAIVRHEGES